MQRPIAAARAAVPLDAATTAGHVSSEKQGRGTRLASFASCSPESRTASRLQRLCLSAKQLALRNPVLCLLLASLVLFVVIAVTSLVVGELTVDDYLNSNSRSSCPAYGPDRAAAETSLLAFAGAPYVVDSEGCVSFCAAGRNGSECYSPTSAFCGLYIVKYGGRAGNAFIQMAVGRMLARRRRAAFIAPPIIEGFGALPAAFQSSCPAAGYSVWPWMWHAPWALQV